MVYKVIEHIIDPLGFGHLTDNIWSNYDGFTTVILFTLLHHLSYKWHTPKRVQSVLHVNDYVFYLTLTIIYNLICRSK